MFDSSVPIKLVECIADLLKYDPDLRLTSKQCLEHPYLLETTPLNNPPGPPAAQSGVVSNGRIAARSSDRNGVSPARSLPSVTPRSVPPSHSHSAVPGRPDFEPIPPVATVQIPEVSASHRSAFYDSPSSQTHYSDSSKPYPSDPVHVRLPNGAVRSRTPSDLSQGWHSYASASASASDSHWDPMEVSPHVEIPPDGFPQPTDIQTSPMVREYPQRPHIEDSVHEHGNMQEVTQPQAPSKLGKFSLYKKPSKWGLATMFGSHGDKNGHALAPVQENPIHSAGSTPSLKRTQSSSTDSRSLSEFSPIPDGAPRIIVDPKLRKKEAARIQKDAEKQRRLLAEKMQKEQARAVLEKNKRMREQTTTEFEWRSTMAMMQGQQPHLPQEKSPVSPGPTRQAQSHGAPSVSAAGGSYVGPVEPHPRGDWRRDERLPKARRRDFDDDHSMSSTDLPSGVSVISFATVESDPSPSLLRHRPSALGISRMTSMSSLGTTMSDDFSPSGRSSNSIAMEQQFANDFHLRASVDSSSVSDGGSPVPPPMHMLTLSSPIPWSSSGNRSGSTLDNGTIGTRDGERPALTIPPQPKHPLGFQPSGPMSPYEPQQSGNRSYPSSPGLAPKSAINPIFKVVSTGILRVVTMRADVSTQPTLTALQTRSGSLPPFSQLEAVAEGEYPPLSPMSFTSPDDAASDFG